MRALKRAVGARAPAYVAAWVRVVPYVVEHLCLCVRRAGCRQCVACSVGQPVCVRVCVPVCCSWMSMSTCGVVSARVGISAFGPQVRGRAYARGWLWTGSWACVCALLGACVVGVGGGRSGDALQEAPFVLRSCWAPSLRLWKKGPEKPLAGHRPPPPLGTWMTPVLGPLALGDPILLGLLSAWAWRSGGEVVGVVAGPSWGHYLS